MLKKSFKNIELLRIGNLQEADFVIYPQKLEIAQEIITGSPNYQYLEINSCCLDAKYH